ncbi:hypothetical protein GYMLUDRAFT_249242 [Collybiopsis luxurians FD-317 M1]|uniref:C2H2-type domain-containing protein n=1 Tax=Collybiopsis luxurians FD-317 M1 TaxID=944289 RepID=A0A0D0CIA8_9AGAR|nr:hypothetical protein GYMLUDRAFT_249242 [Collybiopsis luxurians FD-317 M1]
MSRTQLHPLQLNSLPRTHEHDEYTARPGGNRSTLSWTTNQDDSRPPSPIIDPTPGLPLGLSRPLAPSEQERLAHLDRLKFFLATAPSRWDTSNANASSSSSDPYLNMGMGMNAAHHPPAHPALNRFLLPNQEYVTCVLWNGLYHITGTDIVRALVFRFEAFGRPVRNMKKFEEGVFSDLRNLKPGQDATLEEPKSPFLDLLFKYQCIRTQKKQKVFYWFSVPHDRLFLDALERDLKREKIGHESTTQVVGEPAQSFVYDGAFKRSLYEQFVKAAGGRDGESDLERVVRGLDENGINGTPEDMQNGEISDADNEVSGDEASLVSEAEASKASKAKGVGAPAANNPNSPFFNMFSLFEGSPTYKQRRKKTTRPSALSSTALASTTSAQHGVMADEMAANDGRYDRYTYPTAGDQYPSYSGNTAYGYHPNSSPPGTNHFPHMRNGYGQEVGYGQAYQVNGLSDTSTVRVKEEPVSAADMFLRQARGELVNAAGPTPAEIRAKRHSYAGTGIDTTSVPVWLEGRFAGVGMAATSAAPPPPFASRGRSLDDSMGTSSPYVQAQSNLPSTAGPYPSGSPPTGPSPPASEHSPQAASDSPPGTAEAAVYPNTVAVPGTSPSGAPTTFKAFACPLLSCGRYFKRMEHLKRHLRTHTLERPFACTNEGCGKRFSRSDNLGQHSRVCRGGKSDASDSDVEGVERHSEGGSSLGLTGMGTEWGVNVGEWINSEMDDEAAIDASGKEDGSKGDSEMEGPSSNISVPLNMFGGANGMGMGMGMNSGVSGNAYSAPLDVPMEMCEVELTGDVREVHGDEEGLVRVHVRSDSSDEGYITGESGHYTSEPQQNVENYNQQPSHQFFNSGSYMNHPPQHHSSLDSHLHAPHSHHVRAPSPGHSLDSRLDAQSQWAMRGTPSPAFSTISVPAFTPNRNSWAGGSPSRPQSSYMRQSSGGSSNDNAYGADDSSVPYHSHIQGMNQISVSAPSHKLSFDHGNLYPPGLLDPSSASFAGSMGGLSVDSSTGGGPVRRHRSMTPSLMRTEGGVVRKPTSGGSPGEGVVPNGYHPYASSSRASSLSRGGGSVHSSPAGLPIPLPGMGMQRSESRASNLSVEVAGAEHLQHARQMLSRPGSADPSAAMNYQGEMMYRTDSPASFPNHLPPANGQVTDSPGTFTIDLPSSSYQQSSHLHHSATVPAPSHYGMDDHFGVHNMNGGNYYPHHVSTM